MSSHPLPIDDRRTMEDAVVDLESLLPGEWGLAAACRREDPELFFPKRGSSATQAKAVCHRCPVRKECLDYALEEDLTEGVWGGLTAHERRPMHSRKSKLDRRCMVCHAPFQTYKREERCCSRRCKKKAWGQRQRRFRRETVEPEPDRCVWPGCGSARQDAALCAVHAERIVATGNGCCRWPGCSQAPEVSEALCYAHRKVAGGLLEIETGSGSRAETGAEDESVVQTA